MFVRKCPGKSFASVKELVVGVRGTGDAARERMVTASNWQGSY